jgi:hypothetical protein
MLAARAASLAATTTVSSPNETTRALPLPALGLSPPSSSLSPLLVRGQIGKSQILSLSNKILIITTMICSTTHRLTALAPSPARAAESPAAARGWWGAARNRPQPGL